MHYLGWKLLGLPVEVPNVWDLTTEAPISQNETRITPVDR
jgi:hypothetical protein